MTDSPSGSEPSEGSDEVIGAMLTRLRTDRGYSQEQLAERLGALSGMATVTRHEVSRWERGERVPGEFWLEWLAKVLDTPVSELMTARARTKGYERSTAWLSGTTAVSMSFEHRATSVRLSATYEQPELARAAVGLFGRLVKPDSQPHGPATPARTQPSAAPGLRRVNDRER